ncbi:MAG: hypothetical protein JO227_06890 [Acetobacteraceae bacterium]|nr:hypothetical protein [Acetobacteraceae bacterium]
MSETFGSAIYPGSSGRRPGVTAASLLVLSVVVGVVLFASLRSPLKDDIAWLLYVARRWLAGRELYIDVVEVNPPLIVWISAVPIQIANWLGVDQQLVAIPFFVSAVMSCAWWTSVLLTPRHGVFSDPIPVFAAISTVLLLVPAGDLGQREHLLVAAALPYLALFAGSLDGEQPVAWAAVSAGLLAGLGCALKPRYALVFLALECLAFARGLRPWRLMPLSAATSLVAYGGLVALLCPAYLRRAVPLALALYGATDVSFVHLLADSVVLIMVEGLALLLWWMLQQRMPERSLMLVLVLCAAVSTTVCFMDGKDWFYHRLPATIAVLLALILCVASVWSRGRHHGWGSMVPSVLAAVAGLILSISAIQRLEPEVAMAVEPDRSTVARLEKLIRQEHAHTYIAFSEWIALGFPVVNNTGVAWASRFDSMWALKGELWRARFDPAASREWPIRRWVVHDFIAGCPDLAVVDRRGGLNYVEVLTASDPAFARAWSRYKPVDAFDGLVIYRRSAAGCVDPWVAAGELGTGQTP